ncbi:hypothetical protein EIP91_004261 [Steccherinum ochraceum]|uniref:Uncharacterized protein n=1 Tax=Steccherinum ochraceum TaxID=92696 RepID=A0A4R0RPJ9_9APHY|nr:hypothetical protein EIP91_004261 [Steccherinum ochraceum]
MSPRSKNLSADEAKCILLHNIFVREALKPNFDWGTVPFINIPFSESEAIEDWCSSSPKIPRSLGKALALISREDQQDQYALSTVVDRRALDLHVTVSTLTVYVAGTKTVPDTVKSVIVQLWGLLRDRSTTDKDLLTVIIRHGLRRFRACLLAHWEEYASRAAEAQTVLQPADARLFASFHGIICEVKDQLGHANVDISILVDLVNRLLTAYKKASRLVNAIGAYPHKASLYPKANVFEGSMTQWHCDTYLWMATCIQEMKRATSETLRGKWKLDVQLVPTRLPLQIPVLPVACDWHTFIRDGVAAGQHVDRSGGPNAPQYDAHKAPSYQLTPNASTQLKDLIERAMHAYQRTALPSGPYYTHAECNLAAFLHDSGLTQSHNEELAIATSSPPCLACCIFIGNCNIQVPEDVRSYEDGALFWTLPSDTSTSLVKQIQDDFFSVLAAYLADKREKAGGFSTV